MAKKAPAKKGTVATARSGKSASSGNFGRIVWEHVKSLAGTVVLFLVLRTFFVEAYRIPSGSMIPTMLIGDWLFVNKLRFGPNIPYTNINLPGYADPLRGDVVVFVSPYQADNGDEPTPILVKRLIGMPGDTIYGRDGVVYINGQAQRQGFASAEQTPGDGSMVVPNFDWQKPLGLKNTRFGSAPEQPSVDTWGPLVFVNLDPAAAALLGQLEGMPEHASWIGIDDFRATYMVTMPVAANWKTIVDTFGETYHVQGLHREMLGSMDDIDAPQTIWGHTSMSTQRYGISSPRFADGLDQQSIWESFVLTQGGRMGVAEPGAVPEVPAGQTLSDVITARIVAHQGANGVDLSRFDPDQMLTLIQYNLFPNATVLVTPDLLSVLIATPGPDPDHAFMTAISFTRAAGPDAPRSRPVDVRVGEGEVSLGFVLDADVSVAPRVQQGFHQPGFTRLALASEECRIVNTHRNLERYLGIEPSELSGGPAA